MESNQVKKLLEKTSHLIALTGIQNTEEFLNENSIAEIEAKNQKLLNLVLKLEQESEDARAENENYKSQLDEVKSSQNQTDTFKNISKKMDDLKSEKRQLLEKKLGTTKQLDYECITIEDCQKMKNDIERITRNTQKP